MNCPENMDTCSDADGQLNSAHVHRSRGYARLGSRSRISMDDGCKVNMKMAAASPSVPALAYE
jgi:hypothetical protein